MAKVRKDTTTPTPKAKGLCKFVFFHDKTIKVKKNLNVFVNIGYFLHFMCKNECEASNVYQPIANFYHRLQTVSKTIKNQP